MGIEKAGLQLGKEIIAWTRTNAKSLLATRPVKVNISGLKYTPKLKSDTLELSETSNFIKKLFNNHETSQIKIKINSAQESFTKFEDSQMGSTPTKAICFLQAIHKTKSSPL